MFSCNEYLLVDLDFSYLGCWSENLFLIAPFQILAYFYHSVAETAVWHIPFPINTFTVLKDFSFILFAITAPGDVPGGGPKSLPIHHP